MQQASLFDLLLPRDGGTIGLAGLLPSVCAEMGRVAATYEPGRKMLAEAISAVAKKENIALSSSGAKSVSPELLDKWLAPSVSGHEPSLKAIFCFCIATGTFSPLKPLFKLAGLTVIAQEDVWFLDYGKSCAALKKAQEKKKKLEAGL